MRPINFILFLSPSRYTCTSHLMIFFFYPNNVTFTHIMNPLTYSTKGKTSFYLSKEKLIHTIFITLQKKIHKCKCSFLIIINYIIYVLHISYFFIAINSFYDIHQVAGIDCKWYYFSSGRNLLLYSLLKQKIKKRLSINYELLYIDYGKKNSQATFAYGQLTPPLRLFRYKIFAGKYFLILQCLFCSKIFSQK